MDTGDLIALGIDLGILFYKFYQLGKIDIKLEETDMTVESMKAFNEAMHIEQKEVEEFFGGMQEYWNDKRKSTWLSIYVFIILVISILLGGMYA